MDEIPESRPPDPTTAYVRRVVEGDRAALEWVVARFTPLLQAQARYHLGGRTVPWCDADDLVQETWLRSLDKMPALEAPHGRYTPVLLRYLSTMLLNHLKNVMRKRARRARTEEPGFSPTKLDEVPAEVSGIVTRAVRRERADAVLTAIEGLDAADRELVVLRGIEQQSNQIVGTLLDAKPGTVAVRYHRALTRLREKLPGSVFDDIAEGDTASGDTG